MRLWVVQKFPGQPSTAGGTLRGPVHRAGQGRGAATRGLGPPSCRESLRLDADEV